MTHTGPTRTLVDIVQENAAALGDKTAVRGEDTHLTYRQLNELSDRLAYTLNNCGITKGTRIAYLGKESTRYYEILFGCAKAGAVLVPINWRLTASEISYILDDSIAELVFVDTDFRATVEAAARDLSGLRQIVTLDAPDNHPAYSFDSWLNESDPSAAHLAVPPPPPSADDAIVQIYTSGTTGLPKGVVLAHRSFFAVRHLLDEAELDWIDWKPDDVSLIGVPSFHIGGLWWALQGLNAGVENIVVRTLIGSEVLRLISQHAVTTTCLVPAMLHMVTAEKTATPGHFDSLRKIVYGGSPISEALLERCRTLIKAEFAQIYGLTETGNTAVCLPPAAHDEGGQLLKAAGRPYPGIGIAVRDSNGRDLHPYEVGEICLSTPASMMEYWGLPEATEQALRQGWIHTGDAGYLDEEGYVYLCDRIKDVIIVAGENIYPAEIEKALETLPAVAEAAVIGIPDERWGERLHATVVLAPGSNTTPRQLSLRLRESLAAFKIPSSWEFLNQLPRNPSGKVLRRELREPHWKGRERNVG
ncbi:long-chain-fatty-acid--CoA ligase [Streptomyces sp. NPDC003023]|uniref:long-chain-fatty-acid--CoA ligase n=1 Tax=Streptomyces sp. NPDC003023 TaxID=3364675 RepID=UPI00369C20F7